MAKLRMDEFEEEPLGTGKTVSMTQVIEMAIDALEAKLKGEKR